MPSSITHQILAEKICEALSENVKNIQELSIDDGSRCYRIKNLYGKELGIVVINPADINISKRYEEVFASFENLAAGLDGIENGLTPPAEITENIFAMDDAARAARGVESLPGTLKEAIDAMEADALVCETLGSHVTTQYVEGKRREWDAYRTHVSDWEIGKYLVTY